MGKNWNGSEGAGHRTGAIRSRLSRASDPRITRAACLLVIATIAACGSRKSGPKAPESDHEPAPAGAKFQLRDFHFKSGLRVIGEEDNSAPVVGIVNVVGVGSTSDPPGKEGLAHLVEHLTFRAKQSGRTMWSLFQQAGAGMLNATTDFDSTVYFEFGPRDAALDLLSLEALRMVDPLAGVDQSVFEVEREVVRNELRQRGETVVDGAVWAALTHATYPESHPYSRPPIGTHESLSRITLADAQEFVKRHYRPANMTMVVAGDLLLGNMDKVLAQAFPPSFNQPAPDAKPLGPRIPKVAVEPPAPPPSKGLVTIEGMVTAPELYIAWSLPPSFGPTSHLAQLATGGLRSAMEHAVEVDNDVIGGSVDLAAGAQATTVIANVLLREGSHPEKSAGYVLNGLVYNWTNTADNVMHLWFEQRIARVATLMLFESDDIGQRARERANVAHFTADAAFYGHRMDALGTIGPSQLEDFYVRYLNRDRARTVLVRPIPVDKQAAMGRVGISGVNDEAGPTKYDIASLRKLALTPGLAKEFHTRKLANGLFIQAARHGTAPIVTIGLGFRGGLAEEPENGAATMAWYLATPGSPLHGRFRDHGAIFNRVTSADGVTFRVRATSAHVDKILAILADHVTSLQVRADEFNYFERYALNYIRRDQQRPEHIGDRDFRQALFGSHVFGHVSDIPDDRRPDRAATNKWLEANIAPARAVLAIVGDIDPEEALRSAESAFGGWSGTPGAADPEPLGQAGQHAEVVAHRPGATQAVIQLGCRLPRMDWADRERAKVVSVALSQRIGSVRQSQGASYGLSAWVEALRGGTGVIYIGGAVENAGLATALRTIRNEITRLTTLKGSELDRGRWAQATRYNLDLTTTSEWVAHALEAGKNGWSLESIDNVPDVLASLDANNVLSALRSCTSNGVLSIVGDATLARRAIKEAWLPQEPERRGKLPRP
jgi:zinc protease